MDSFTYLLYSCVIKSPPTPLKTVTCTALLAALVQEISLPTLHSFYILPFGLNGINCMGIWSNRHKLEVPKRNNLHHQATGNLEIQSYFSSSPKEDHLSIPLWECYCCKESRVMRQAESWMENFSTSLQGVYWLPNSLHLRTDAWESCPGKEK